MTIHCRGVHKAYRFGARTVEALRGVDLSIDRSGFFAIMGQSGSGKTTLLNLIGALDSVDSGEIEVAGERIDLMNERRATLFRRREIGFIFQQFNLVPALTAIENVTLPGLLAGEKESALKRRAMDLLDQFGLADRATHVPGMLSGGEQQRVAIARSLLFSPPVILADEPSGNLDSKTSMALWSQLASLASERDITVVMVTHEPSAAAYCERVFVIRDGRAHGEIDTEGLDARGVAARCQELVGET